ncbi:hypothetical protein C8F04DRAFT_1287680 [Mycena alexandri]|uniref:Uncharacterized protein n=1 Tax=Mycena alexandri TaxID=1745969 RepID=A0AAD6TD96_9AGAR|nr:hypothetical protein C8F04DRAFT_1287680 [Mycena alexandri]
MDGDETASDDTRPKADVRRSLSFFAKNLDFSALIRSSSLTSRHVSANEDRPHTRRRSKKVTLDYVKQEMLDDLANERTSRPTKPESGILNLISRSRSTSRSKPAEEVAQVAIVDVPELPVDAAADPNGPHKPPQLLQSRPLSAATTNTASTVTPANVTPRKRTAPSRIPIATVKEEPGPTPVAPEAKQPPKKTFLGIPLPSPRKSSFGSRPTSPSEPSPVPIRRKGSSSPHRAAAASPTPKSKAKVAKQPKPKPDIGEGPAPSSTLDSLSKFFVGTGMRVSSNPETSRPAATPTSKPTSKIPPSKHTPVSQKPSSGPHISPSTVVTEPVTPKAIPKQPSRRHMSEVGNTARAQEPVTPTPAPRAGGSSMSAIGVSTARTRVSGASAVGSPSSTHIRSSISNPHPRASVVGSQTSADASTLNSPPTPRVRASSTGATQAAIGVASGASGASGASSATSSLSTRERRTSTDSGHGYRAYRPHARLGGIEEWRGKEGETDNSPAHSAIPPGPIRKKSHVTANTLMTATTTGPKSTIGTASGRKHGSFDFERPGWGGGLANRGASSSLGVASRNRREMRGASGSVDSHRDRGTSAGIAGIGAARLYASTSGTHRAVRVVPPPTPPEIEPNHTGASTSTSASQSNVTGGTSSWGRSTGKRLSAGLTKLTSGLGLGRSTKSTTTIGAGKERQHGKFAFEPPVPALPVNVRRELSMDSAERERERQWEREDKELGIKPRLASKGHATSHSTSSTSSTHTGVSAGHRSGKKGRSLDLGLGLAWAPTKVREDAVMPESSFGRTLSASRREQQGKEVAEVFRIALNEDGYRSFKKCEFGFLVSYEKVVVNVRAFDVDVHRFDAHEIPFDGPTGIVTRIERLLRKAQHLTDDEREKLLDAFVKLILQTA